MIIKATKKRIMEKAKDLKAYYYGGNVYDYENAIHLIENYNYTSKDIKKHIVDNKYYNREDLRNLICKYKKKKYKMSAKQLYYSCGLYGNSGQLHEVNVYTNKWTKLKDTFYIYYC